MLRLADFPLAAKALWSSGHLSMVLRDIGGAPAKAFAERKCYIEAVAAWLARAQDASPDDGVSAAYSMIRGGWQPSYPETTGYIIGTMLDYAVFSGSEEYRDRALRMADWLLEIQMESGAFPGGTIESRPAPRVFNTGQIMIGLLRAYRETGRDWYLEAANRSGLWLIGAQSEDGSWAKHNYNPISGAPTYNTRVAWPLLELGGITGCGDFIYAAAKFLDWVQGRQLENGWFPGNETIRLKGALTHFLGYTASGLIEGGKALGDQRYLNAAQRLCEAMRGIFFREGRLAATYEPAWEKCYRFSCLTGDAQFAVAWFQLYELTRDPKYLDAAARMNMRLRREIDMTTRNMGIRGALKGASPIWGRYMAFAYPSWASKFLLDSLLLEERFGHNSS